MPYKNFVIGPDKFEEFGIKSCYDVSTLIDEVQYSSEDQINIEKRSSVQDNSLEEKQNGSLESVNKDAKDTGRIVRGFVATTDKDRVDDIIPFSTFKESKDDLTKKGSSTVFFNHDSSIPIGVVSKTNVNRRGMFAEIFISKADDVENIWTKVKEGIINSFSVTLKPKKVEIVRDEESGVIDSFRILSMELFEASLVGVPANSKANVVDVIEKSFKTKANELNKEIKTNSGDVMNDKEKTMTEVASKIIDEKLAGFQKSLAEATAKIAADAATEAGKKAISDIEIKKEEEAAKLKEQEQKNISNPALQDKKSNQPSEVQKMSELILEGIEKLVEKNRPQVKDPVKKGVDQNTESDEYNVVPRKVLKSAEDIDTMKYVVHVLYEDPDKYKQLTDREKAKVKQFWLPAQQIGIKTGLISQEG